MQNTGDLRKSRSPLSQMKDLYAYMKSCDKKTVLEVVAYTQAECMSGAKMAAECGCDF